MFDIIKWRFTSYLLDCLEFFISIHRQIKFGNRKKYACVRIKDEKERFYTEIGIGNWLNDNGVEVLYTYERGISQPGSLGAYRYHDPRCIIKAEDINFVLIATDKFERVNVR